MRYLVLKVMSNKLIFLYNELLSPQVHNVLRIPLQFISFAYVKGKMYTHGQKVSCFTIPLGVNKHWGNTCVYGGLFLLRDWEFYTNILDAYHTCSLSTLFTNHRRDIHHRKEVMVTPISFDGLQNMGRLMYHELKEVECSMYFGNTSHAKIRQRLDSHNSYRIIDGVSKKHFKQLYQEVANGK